MVRILSAFIIVLLVTAPAFANLDAAKANGHACELSNGYLRANSGAPADVQNLVNSINAQRKAQYEKIAKKNGVGADQVATLTAQKLIQNAPQFACK